MGNWRNSENMTHRCMPRAELDAWVVLLAGKADVPQQEAANVIEKMQNLGIFEQCPTHSDRWRLNPNVNEDMFIQAGLEAWD